MKRIVLRPSDPEYRRLDSLRMTAACEALATLWPDDTTPKTNMPVAFYPRLGPVPSVVC